jgi:hypothetical protein
MSNTPANNVADALFAVLLFVILTVGNGILISFILRLTTGD